MINSDLIRLLIHFIHLSLTSMALSSTERKMDPSSTPTLLTARGPQVIAPVITPPLNALDGLGGR